MRALSWLVILSCGFVLGCNSSKTEVAKSKIEPANGQELQEPNKLPDVSASEVALSPTATNPVKLPVDAEPSEVVKTFLSALKSGDQFTAERLLTDVARVQTRKANLEVRPPGSASSRFMIGESRYATERKDIAHVESMWSESSDAGHEDSFSITWVLKRQENASYRIAGMLTAPAPEFPPVFLNFENPTEMLAKAEQAEVQSSSTSTTSPVGDSGVRQASFGEEIK